MNLSNWLKLIALALLWGSSFVFVEIALEGFGPLTLVLVRVGLAAAVLWSLVLLRGHAVPRQWRDWGAYAVMGLLANVLPFALISWGQQSITAGMAAMLNATVPMFTLLIAMASGSKEPGGPRRLAGLTLSFFGVAWLLGSSGGTLALGGIGQYAVLGAAICYAAGAVFGKRFSGQSPLVNSAAMLSCSTVMMAPLAFAIERPLATLNPDVTSWVALVALAVMSTALAYLLYFAILKSAGATCLGLVTYLIPLVSTGLGCMVLGEAPGFRELAAMSVVFAGLSLIDPSVFRGIGSRFRQSGGARKNVPTTMTKNTGGSCQLCPKRGRCVISCRPSFPEI